MGDLRDLFVGLGYDDVQTYILSGNVIFRATGTAEALEKAIEKRIARDLGLPIRVLVRTAAEMKKIGRGNPFAKKGADPSTLHVNFMATKPTAASVKGLDPVAGAPDEFAIAGREVYVHCPNGYGRSKLNNAFFEKKLGTAGTTRNWKTVSKLCELAKG
jgi:uncharacterized protein (DUF1697 family)